jgi:aminoglycoside phosphotransferase (APT) family kinase protein
VMSGVRGLARMHQRYWDLSTATPPELDWLQTWEATEGFTGALRGRADRGLERMAGQLPAELDDVSGDDLVDLCARYIALLGRDPTTLLHGDAHIGNSFVTPDGDVGFFDWQVTRRGNWSQDIGYFIQGALVEADRHRFERELVEAYRNELDRGLSEAAAWTWYRASPLYGLPVWLATLGSDRGSQPVDIASALSRRYAGAMVTLDSVSAVVELETLTR